MSNPVEECKDEDLPANTLEHFTELQQVLEMIENIKSIAARTFEREFEQYAQVLSRYQEQPHLLDPHLEELLGKLLQKIRRPDLDEGERHGAFKYLYIICKVRTYKVMVKFMPHELSDLEFVLDLLGQQDPKEFEQWETRYILLLWMSILVLNPFHMARLDAYETAPNDTINSSPINHVQSKSTKMERIYELIQLYVSSNDTCSSMRHHAHHEAVVRIVLEVGFSGRIWCGLLGVAIHNRAIELRGGLPAAISFRGRRWAWQELLIIIIIIVWQIHGRKQLGRGIPGS